MSYDRLDPRTLPSRAWPPFAQHAACSADKVDPDDFFPNRQLAGVGARQAARALAVCGSCLVRRDCLSWAIETDQRHGIWGGATSAQRTKLRARR